MTKKWDLTREYDAMYPDFGPSDYIYIHLSDEQKFRMVAKELVAILTEEQAIDLIMSLTVEGKVRLETEKGQWADITVRPRLN